MPGSTPSTAARWRAVPPSTENDRPLGRRTGDGALPAQCGFRRHRLLVGLTNLEAADLPECVERLIDANGIADVDVAVEQAGRLDAEPVNIRTLRADEQNW